MATRKYELRERLGGGAVGQVWRAVDQYRRNYAIKFFKTDDPWKREAQALAHASALTRVRHPGVVEVIAVERIPDPDSKEPELAIVMEYLEGIDLAHFQDQLPIDRAIRILETLAGGLQAIHDVGLVHNDLHIGNVLVTSSSAKLLDIAYEKTLAGAGSATSLRTRADDIRDFARVVRAVLNRVPNLNQPTLVDCHYRAEQAASPAEVVRAFATCWRTPGFGAESSKILGAEQVHLVVQRPTRDSVTCTTYVVVDGRIAGTVPTALLEFRGQLLRLQDPGREITILRESLRERWEHSIDEPQPSDYERKRLSSPCFVAHPSNQVTELASTDPQPGSQEQLFIFERLVTLKGFLGPFLFIEQLDYKYGGGAHPDATRIAYVIDLRSGQARPSILDERERLEFLSREGKVARESFIHLRDTEPLFSEVEVELAASYPSFEANEQEAKLRLVFTTFTSYADSEFRWGSYMRAEEIQARALPEMLKPFANVPREVTQAMGAIPGIVVGWSTLTADDAGFESVTKLTTFRQNNEAQDESSVIHPTPQLHSAAPWRSPHHGKTDSDLAQGVARQIATISSTLEVALRSFPFQLEVEFTSDGRVLTPALRAELEEQGRRILTDYFGDVPPHEP